jgi:hypothetical protein
MKIVHSLCLLHVLLIGGIILVSSKLEVVSFEAEWTPAIASRLLIVHFTWPIAMG